MIFAMIDVIQKEVGKKTVGPSLLGSLFFRPASQLFVNWHEMVHYHEKQTGRNPARI